MKRVFIIFLLSILLLSIALLNIYDCGSDKTPLTGESLQNHSADSAAVGTASVDAGSETPIEESTSAQSYSGQIYLTISQLTFSLVGEKEDIYCGTIPREEIVWTSGDESVVSVENGVVTAVGVGQATVWAEYGDQKQECTVGCLAESFDELYALSDSILLAPRKYPPLSDGQPVSYYDDAVIIGDSVSYSLLLWAAQTGEMGNATFLVRGGNSITGYVTGRSSISFQGAERTIEDAVALSGAKKAFIMMGVNDLGYLTVEETMENLDIMIDRIREKNPDIQIYLESCLPVWDPGIQATKNVEVEAYNTALITYARENDFIYIEVASYIKDHTGGMAECYCADYTTHMNYDGTDAWMQALKLYAHTQE